MIEHELARGLLRDLVAEILRRHRQRQIDAGADPRRTPDIAVADENPVGLQLHLGIGGQKMPGALPMRGGAAAVEQAGFGEDVGAGADAGDADAAFGHRPHERQRLVAGAAARTPSPPATIRVVIAPDGLKPRASNSTPEELRTGPGVAASTLIDGRLDRRGSGRVAGAISNTEIGPAASSNWKSGKTRMPIMVQAPRTERTIARKLDVLKRGKYGISDRGDHGTMPRSSKISPIKTRKAPVMSAPFRSVF